MTPDHKRLIRRSLQLIVPIAEPAADLFYARLFELDPSLRSLFRGDSTQQGRKLLSALRMAVASLDRMEALLPLIGDLGRRQASDGVRDSHYDTVGAALIWTLEQSLGAEFTPATKAAWRELYGLLAATMKEAAAVTPTLLAAVPAGRREARCVAAP